MPESLLKVGCRSLNHLDVFENFICELDLTEYTKVRTDRVQIILRCLEQSLNFLIFAESERVAIYLQKLVFIFHTWQAGCLEILAQLGYQTPVLHFLRTNDFFYKIRNSLKLILK